MLRVIAAQVRHRWTRTAALLVGILVAATSFTVLSGSAQTSQARVTGTVTGNFRSAYDILVRPAGSMTAIERQRGLVQQNYLSGIYGGITLNQYDSVRALAGIEVAAPIAMVGYVDPKVELPVDVTSALSAAPQQLLRLTPTWISDRGLTRARDAAQYLYVTTSPLSTAAGQFDVSEHTHAGDATVCHYPITATSGPFSTAVRSNVGCWSRVNGDSGLAPQFIPPGFKQGEVGFLVDRPSPMLIAAIDPVQEARLDAVDRTVVSGRYLSAQDGTDSADGVLRGQLVPILSPIRPYQDEQLSYTVERLPAAEAAAVTRGSPLSPTTAAARLNTSGTPVLSKTIPLQTTYRQLLTQLKAGSAATTFTGLDAYWTPGPVSYAPGTPLTPRIVTNPDSTWTSHFQGTGYSTVPLLSNDVGFRSLREQAAAVPANGSVSNFPVLRSVGEFDPAKLPGFSPLSAVPLQTYNPPQAAPADQRSRQLLHGQDLLPNGNMAGYLQSPPLILTSLSALPAFTNSAAFPGTNSSAPISTIRVRVTGVTGPDKLSRERVRLVAQQIQQRTGLNVDITLGSSPTPVTVQLPAGKYGRPPLAVSEGWVKKGVAVAIITGVDRKSLTLAVLILAVCALFVINAASAAVRSRRTELGILSCLGWSAARLFSVILIELASVGLAAGAGGSLLALPLSHAVGVHASPARAALAVPAAVLLAVLAGVIPARRAARADPAAATRPAVQLPRRAHAPRSVLTLGLTNLIRMPARALIGAASLDE